MRGLWVYPRKPRFFFMNYGTASRIGSRCLRWLCVFVGLLESVALAVSHRYHVVTDTNFGALSVQEYSGGTWNHHVDLTWYGPAYGAGAGYQVDASLANNTSFTVRVVGAGLPGGGPLESKTFNSGTSFATTSWTPSTVTNTYFLNVTVTNSTDFPRIVYVDIGCNGSMDDHFTLQPGEGYALSYEESAWSTVCLDSGRLGPDGEIIRDLPIAEFDENSWDYTNAPPPAIPIDIKPGDSSTVRPAGTNATASIVWGPGTSTNQVGTLQQGFSVLRSTVVEGDKAQNDLLSQIASNTMALNQKFTHPSNATSLITYQTSQASTGSIWSVYTSARDGLQGITTNTSGTGALTLDLYGTSIDLTGPGAPASVQALRPWVYHALQWFIWLSYAGVLLHLCRTSIHALIAAPSQGSAASVPGVSSGFAVAGATFVAVAMGTFAAAVFSGLISVVLQTVVQAGPWAGSWSGASTALGIAVYWVPLADIVATTVTALLYEAFAAIAVLNTSVVSRLVVG